ncbi:MAG TPA: N-methyl-L-tryptophan oxidase [Actinomycetota bacterium]|nr:N-methyl-L-tryptophan oxidase [Actinomycetota bacterium]
MAQRFDVIVIGAGVVGTAAARALAERGRSVVLLERFEVGHGRGSSGGATRVFRLAYRHPDYVRMARFALGEWRALEARSGERLLVTTGGLDLGEGAGVAAKALRAAGERADRLRPEEVVERWPALRVPPGREVVFQQDAGVCLAERTVRAQARIAVEEGVVLLEHTPVDHLVATGFGVEARTPADAYLAPVGVVTAGAWTPGLLAQVGLDLPLVPTLEQVTFFELDDPTPMPTVIDWNADPAVPHYVVPNPEEPGAFKVGLHRSGRPVDPDARPFDPDPERVRRAVAFAEGIVPAARPTGASETCLYTNAPDEDFVLDRRGPIVIGSACSGHGFKFAPLVGRILADLATATPAPLPIERFLSSRPALAR